MTTRLATLAATATLLLAAACGSSDKDDDTKAADDLNLVKDGTLTVCSDVPYAPFEDFDKGSELGFTGFDIELVNAIAEGLDLKLEVTDQAFDGLQSGLTLNSGTCDLVASAMSINADRKKNLAFSDGYYVAEQSLLVPDGSDIKSIDDLAGKKVAVQKTTTGATFAKKNAKGAQIIEYPSDAEEFAALKAGQVDAILQDLPVNVEHAKDDGFTVVETYPTKEEYGFAAKKDNVALIKAVNAELEELRDNGEYDTIYDKYFTVE